MENGAYAFDAWHKNLNESAFVYFWPGQYGYVPILLFVYPVPLLLAHKYFTRSGIDKPKKKKECMGPRPARVAKDANRIQTNDRNNSAVHIVWALEWSWENVTQVTGIWRMSFVTGSVWPRLSTSLSFNDTRKCTHVHTHAQREREIERPLGTHVYLRTWHKHTPLNTYLPA